MTVIFGIYLRYYRIKLRRKYDAIRIVNPIEIRFPTFFPLLMCSSVRSTTIPIMGQMRVTLCHECISI